ncbi:hypothetical protein DEM26_16540 [Thioclava sp. NG1]|nr:hypothetical protein DEM26_16540 [Thioclava sp. NG1]
MFAGETLENLYLYVALVLGVVWFLIHFIWTFRFFRWLFNWRYDSPFAVFISRLTWGAAWVIIPVMLLTSSGG